MTTHELAAALLAMKNVEVCIEGWTSRDIKCVVTSYDPNTVILVNALYYRDTNGSRND